MSYDQIYIFLDFNENQRMDIEQILKKLVHLDNFNQKEVFSIFNFLNINDDGKIRWDEFEELLKKTSKILK